jgi:hypothetical protein
MLYFQMVFVQGQYMISSKLKSAMFRSERFA